MAYILVIDDNDELRGTLRAILEEGGFEVREARNGREGIACCQKDTVALVLTDLLMPVTPHLAPYARIKRHVVARIESGEWKVASRVPSENQLAAEFEVSRMTARRALLELVQEGGGDAPMHRQAGGGGVSAVRMR